MISSWPWADNKQTHAKQSVHTYNVFAKFMHFVTFDVLKILSLIHMYVLFSCNSFEVALVYYPRENSVRHFLKECQILFLIITNLKSAEHVIGYLPLNFQILQI